MVIDNGFDAHEVSPKKYIYEKTSIENIDVSIKSTLHKKLNIFFCNLGWFDQ